VRQLEDARPIRLRHADELADDTERQRLRDVDDDVELVMGDGGFEQAPNPGFDRRPECLDRPRRKRRQDESPKDRVVG
jgi:hypothetical protein